MVDSWIHSLSTYFKTSPEMKEDNNVKITSLQLEGIAQAWWDMQLEQCELVIEVSETTVTGNACITS
jgi:hypothetical protein